MNAGGGTPPSRFFNDNGKLFFACHSTPDNNTVLWQWSGNTLSKVAQISSAPIVNPTAYVPFGGKLYGLSIAGGTVSLWSCCGPPRIEGQLGSSAEIIHPSSGDMVLRGNFFYWAATISYIQWDAIFGTWDVSTGTLGPTPSYNFDSDIERASAVYLSATKNNVHFIRDSSAEVRLSPNPSSITMVSPTPALAGSFDVDNVGDRRSGPGIPFSRCKPSAFTLGNSTFFLGQSKTDAAHSIELFECRDDTLNCSSIYTLATGFHVYLPNIWAQYSDTVLFFTAPTPAGLGVYRIDNAGVSGLSASVALTPLVLSPTRYDQDMTIVARANATHALVRSSRGAADYGYTVASIRGGSVATQEPTFRSAAPPPMKESNVKSAVKTACFRDWCWVPFERNAPFLLHMPTNAFYEIQTTAGAQGVILSVVSGSYDDIWAASAPSANGIVFLGNITGRRELFFVDVFAADGRLASNSVFARPLGFTTTFPLSPDPEAEINLLDDFREPILSSDGRLITVTEDTALALQYIFSVSLLPSTFGNTTVLWNKTATQITKLSPVLTSSISFFENWSTGRNITTISADTGAAIASVYVGSMDPIDFVFLRNGTLLASMVSATAVEILMAVYDSMGIHSAGDILFDAGANDKLTDCGSFVAGDSTSRRVIIASYGQDEFSVWTFFENAANWTQTPQLLASSATLVQPLPVVSEPQCLRFSDPSGKDLLALILLQRIYLSNIVSAPVPVYSASETDQPLVGDALLGGIEYPPVAFLSSSSGPFLFTEFVVVAKSRFMGVTRWFDSLPCLDDTNCASGLKCVTLPQRLSRFCIDPSRLVTPPPQTIPGVEQPPSQSTVAPCGQTPIPGATCQLGSAGSGSNGNQQTVWFFEGSVTVGGANSTAPQISVPAGTLLIIKGSFEVSQSVPATTVTLSVSPGASVEIDGCASFAGALQLGLTPAEIANGTGTLPVIAFNGFCGGTQTQFGAINIDAAGIRACERVSPPQSQYTSRSLSVVFDVDDSGCDNGALSGGVNVPLIAGLVGGIGGGLLLILIISLIVWRKFLRKKDADEQADIEEDRRAASANAAPLQETKVPKKGKKPKSNGETQYTAIASSQNATTGRSDDAAILNIPGDKIKILHKLGEGSYGAVFLGLYDGSFVAVKKLLKSMLSAELDALYVAPRVVNLLEMLISFFASVSERLELWQHSKLIQTW